MNNVKGRELGGVFPPEPIVTTNLKEKIMKKLTEVRTEYYDNGQKKFEGNTKNGKFDGLVTEWYETGEKEFEAIYKDGEPEEQTEWDREGELVFYLKGNSNNVLSL